MKNVFRMMGVLFIGTALTLSLFGCGKNKKQSEGTESSARQKEENTSFRVLNFTPEGELPANVTFPSIQVQFSEPVVALKELGKPTDKSDFVKIVPELKGTYRWFGTSLLSFECSDGIIPQKEYTIVVSDKTKSIGGEKITGQLEYKFHSEELKIASVLPGYEEVKKGHFIDTDDVPVEEARDIAIFFNLPVNLNTIIKEIEIHDDEKKYQFSAKKESDTVIRLTLKETPPKNTTLDVVLPEGSMADSDCYKTTEEQTFSFHTLVPFTVEKTDAEPQYLDSSFSNPVQIFFSHGVKEGSEAEVAKHISTVPKMQITAKNISIGGKTIVIHSLPVAFESTYSITIDAALADAYGQKLAEKYSTQITVPSAASFVYFKDNGFKMLESQFAPKLVFEFQNIIKDKSLYEITPLTRANGKLSSSPQIHVDFGKRYLEKNTKILEPVNLEQVLENTGTDYRGSLFFYAKIGYTYKYTDWNSGEKKQEEDSEVNSQVIQVTNLGMTVRYAYNRAEVLVTSLSTGEPVANAAITVYSVGKDSSYQEILVDNHGILATGTTNEDGFTSIPFEAHQLQRMDDEHCCLYIEAKTDNDRAIFQPNIYSLWSTPVESVGYPDTAETPRMVSFIFTDRGLYKPGETITFRGIDRNLKAGEYSPYKGDYRIEFTDGAWDPSVYGKISSTTTNNGTFWGKWKIPEDLEPGTYSIDYIRNENGEEQKQRVQFQVQFFERLRFEAKASLPAITYYSGDKLDAEVSAAYLGGGSLAGCTYTTAWSREPHGFAPKGNKFEGMRFGPLQGYDGRTSLDEGQGALSGDGKATVSQQTGGEKLKGMAYDYRMEAKVTDSGNQMISATTNVLVHPAKFYIGVSRIKGITGFPVKGDALKFDYVCVTPEGTTPSAKELPTGKNKSLKIELLREDWKEVQQVGWNGQINTRYEREMVSEQEKETTLSATTSEISVVPPKGGAYVLRLSTHDSRGNEAITETRFYVMSEDWIWFDRDNAQEITMTADKDMYSVGDTAHILMQSSLPKGTYLMTIEREGIIESEVRHINEPTTVIDVTVKDRFVPVMYVTLSSYSVRTGKPKNTFTTPDLDKPKGYFGLAVIHVNPEPRKFDVEIKTDKPSYRPGETAKITIHAAKAGVPISQAEITLMAVDRGVIDLINYHVNDPVAYFYSEDRFPDCVRGGDSRSLLMDPVTYEVRNLFGGDSADDSSKIQERKNFEPTALFVPDLVTDENGNASCTFKLPDSLTAYRITAVGVKENNFSLGESEMPVANPVSVRDVLPRKLRLNDNGELGVTISNLDAQPHELSVQLAVYDGIEKTGIVQAEDDVQKLPGTAEVSGMMEKKITVQPNTTVPLMFAIHAKKQGWITVEYTVHSDVVNERILKPLEIEKPYVYETVTTVGEARSVAGKENEATAEEKIIIPSDAEDDKGNIYVQLDATRLGVLREAVQYVFLYPYGCMEQRSSFVMPLTAFGNYIKVFGLESEVHNPASVVKKEVKSWAKVQHADGGFPYWPDDSKSDLFVSTRIGEIIALGDEKGMSLSKLINANALAEYIQTKLNEVPKDMKTSGWYTYSAAYGYYVIQRLGKDVSDRDIKTIAESKSGDISSTAWCALTYYEKGEKGKAEALAKKIRQYTKYSTRGIDITSMQGGFDYWSYYNDKCEDYALLLHLFSKIAPSDDINQHIVYELLEFERAGNHGYWKSTAVTSRVLSAIDVYIRANNLQDTNFTAEALLDGKKFVEGKFKGAGATPAEKRVDFAEEPVKEMKRGKELSLTFSKKGTGRLFYTASMKYAIPPAKQTALENGICIYTIITDVKTGEIIDDTKLTAGTVYREKVFVTTTKDCEFVAVRAPIPAGCEVMNAAFVTTGTYPSKNEQEENPDAEMDVYSEDGWDYSDYWYEDSNYGLSHQTIYDDEVQYFWNIFPKGNQQVEFLFRATRKGTYNTPSGTAECMYQPEIFGRTAGKVWTIE